MNARGRAFGRLPGSKHPPNCETVLVVRTFRERAIEMALSVEPTGDLADAWTGPPDGATDSIALVTARNAYGREGREGTIERTVTQNWRVDRQKNVAGGRSNLQVQKNGANRPSTAACLIVSNQYFFQLDGPDTANREAELTRILRHGLNVSLDSWIQTTEAGPRGKRAAVVKVFEVRGEYSSPRPDFVSPQKPVR